MRISNPQTWLVGAVLLLSNSLGIAADIAAGKASSTVCVACHGADGNSQVKLWPKIAGQHAPYLNKQLQDYKAGRRINANMQAIVASLSAQTMKNLSAFYASQTMTIETAQPENLALGEKLYRGGNVSKGVTACIACHGPQGLGNAEAGFPRLGGQHAEYTAKQLHDYKAGRRQNGLNGIMLSISQKLDESEIKALANYISGLH